MDIPVVPDFNTYACDATVRKAEIIEHGVRVTWSDGVATEHHRFVLRENSPDPITTHPISREQQVQFSEMPADLSVVEAGPSHDGGLAVRWSHGPAAESTYAAGWLRAWAVGADVPHALPQRVVWDGELRVDELLFDGAEVLDGGDTFARFLTTLHTHGVAIVDGLTIEADMIERLPSMIGPIRDTNFGRAFEVRTKAVDVTSNAYTDLELPVHADLCTREYMPGLQFLWCMVNDATGGESRLADGAAVAEHLRLGHPAAFEALTTIPIGFVNKAADTDYRHVGPFLQVDGDGALVEARWSPWLRAPLQASIADAERFYAALRLALQLGDDPAFAVTHRLEAGQMLAFDNRRILHGRAALDRSSGDRWLRGCYVEREELDSRLRVLLHRPHR